MPGAPSSIEEIRRARARRSPRQTNFARASPSLVTEPNPRLRIVSPCRLPSKPDARGVLDPVWSDQYYPAELHDDGLTETDDLETEVTESKSRWRDERT